MTISTHSRSRGCLFGLAVGDALGGPTEGKTREEIVRTWNRVTEFLHETQGGSDDTEYALFNAKLLLWHGRSLTAHLIAEAWKREIARTENPHHGAGFSEMLALRNLRAGLLPPRSGRHIHAWSDGVAMRVAPFGIVAAGRPEIAAQLAAMDGSVTHSGEGIFAGQAVAAAVAAAVSGGSATAIVDAARHAVPPDSWTRRALDRGVAVGESSPDMWSALTPLYDAIVCAPYFWSDVAPEAVGLAFGVFVAARGGFRESILGGANVGRDTDTIAAIAGAIAGAHCGVDAIPPEWRKRVTVARGTCLKTVEGMDIERIADQLADLSEHWTP